jgi:hypothetical protein
MARETIGQAWVAVTPDTDRFGQEADKGVSSAIGGLAKKAAALFAAVAVKDFVGDIIGAAGDMQETVSKTNAIFGSEAAGLLTWAEGAATAMGQSKQQALDAASTFAVFGKGAGLAGSDLSGFATELTGVASDLASFHNASPEEAIQAIGAGLRGEAEPLRRFGILLDDATLRAKALEMGLITTTKDALTPQQKVLASQAVIMSQLGDAQGDFARTSGGLANQQRILSAEFANAKTELGERLLPIATKITSFLASNMGPALDFVQGIIQTVADKIAIVVEAFKGGETSIVGVNKHFTNLGVVMKAIVDWAIAAWPTVQAALQTAFQAIGVAMAFVADEVIPRVVAAFQTVVAWVVENWPTIQATIATVIDWITTYVVPAVEVAIGYVVEQFGHLVEWVQTNWPLIQETVATVINAIWAVIQAVIETIADAWGAWGDELIEIVVTVWDYITKTVQGAIDLVRGIIETVMALITGDWSGAWDGIKGILSTIWDQIVNIVTTALSILGSLLSIAWTTIKAAAGLAWDGIKSVIGTAIDAVVGFVTAIPGRIAATVDGLWEAFKTEMTEAKDWVGDRIDEVVKFATGLPGKLAGKFSGMWDGIKDAFRSALNTMIRGWNRIEFKIPGFKVGPVGYDGFTLGVPKIPELHTGGIYRAPQHGGEGLALLRDGERVLSVDETNQYDRGAGGRGGPLIVIERFVANDALDVEELGRTLGHALAAEGVAA